MDGRDLFEHHLSDRSRRGPAPDRAHTGAAGGAACGDHARISLAIEAGSVRRVTFDAAGCGATVASASAVAEAVEGATVLDAARLGTHAVAELVGGLSPGKLHAAEVAADALHRALAAAASSGARLAGPPDTGERVLVAMSGGVDSAVAALLEREAGREVVAVTLKLWADRRTDGERSCCSPEAVVQARSVAHSLAVPHLTLDLEEAFRDVVVSDFVAGYERGVTPNPCVRCNGLLRIDAMLALAGRLGAESLATGHYARIADDGEGPLLAAPADPAKDQTYMLAAVKPSTLARLRFPLAGLRKSQVREIARRAGLAVASRAESQDLCFLAGEGKEQFLRRHAAPVASGEIVDGAGNVLGTHPGQRHFTVGQRRGLGVAAPEPLYVVARDAATNRIRVGRRDELASASVRVTGATLHRGPGAIDGVRLRSHAGILPCRAAEHDGNGNLTLTLAEPADAVVPGQTACLMSGEMVVGAGTISGS